METDTQNSLQVKKKGRPRKTPLPPLIVGDGDVQVVEQEKKKRGRKKKEKVEEEEVKQKKKRGRKAAIKFFSSSIRKKIPLTTVMHDTDKTILHLDIKEENEIEGDQVTYEATDVLSIFDDFVAEENHVLTKDSPQDQDDQNISELYEKRLQVRMNQDSNLTEKLENLHNDDNLFNKLLQQEISKSKKEDLEKNAFSLKGNEDNRKKKFFHLFDDFYENKSWLKETDIACWWCCHNFNTVPLGLPIKYENKKFTVKGIFCSFACISSYNKNESTNKYNNVPLIHFLYKKLTGILVDCGKDLFAKSLVEKLPLDMFNGDIQLRDIYIEGLMELRTAALEPAPPRCALKKFGGELSIEEFRASTKEHKMYNFIEYPLSICRDYVEEVDIRNVKRLNLKAFNKTEMVLDNNKIEEVQTRLTSSLLLNEKPESKGSIGNSMDRFIRF
jgi:hypothetical protein